MGMDVYGLAPRSKVGEYFRRSVWSWHPLADYVRRFSAAQHCDAWHFNDGYGLNDKQARTLAIQITNDILSDNARKYVQDRDNRLARMDSIDCNICGGTGKRKEPPQIGPGDLVCNGCNGEGKVRPTECSYVLRMKDINEFVAFLEDCGGFKIC